MNILHVCHRYWPCVGGSERYMQEISERLVREGHTVTVYTTDAYDVELFWRPGFRRIAAQDAEHNGVRIRRFRVRHLPLHLLVGLGLGSLPVRKLDLLLHPPSPLVPDLMRADSARFDVVHTSSLPYNSMLFGGYRLARRSGARLVTTPHVHTGEPGSKRVSQIYMRPAQRWLLAQSDIVVARTPSEAGYLTAQGFPSDRLRVIACGINPSELAGGDGPRFRARHGLSLTEPIVFYLGMRAFDKGTQHLVEAMRQLWRAGTHATLVLAGASQPHFRRFWRRQPSEVRERTLVLDSISDAEKRDLLAAGQVFAMPSRNDTFGIVYLEAWAYGIPVIGANAGGIPDVITHGEDGLIVPFGDVRALATSVGRLVDDPELRNRLGSQGKYKTLSHWTWDALFDDVRALYACA
jgi:glycosyltransferase involved in cell wall biosynthesis